MRLYNGAPDSELQAIWDRRDAIRAELAKHGVRVVYYPTEDGYMGWRGGVWYDHKNVCHDTGEVLSCVTTMCSSLEDVLQQVKEKLNGHQN